MVSAKRIRLITFLTASIFAVAISFSHVSKSNPAAKPEKATQLKGGQPEASGDLIPLRPLSVHSLSLPATFHLRTNVLSWFLFRIFSLEHPVQNFTDDLSRGPDVLFEIIFTFFISPNAP